MKFAALRGAPRLPDKFYRVGNGMITIIRKGDRIPFDIAGMRTVQFDLHDPDSVEETRREISSQIENLEHQSKEIETPISVSLNLQALKASDRPEDRSLAELLVLGAKLRSGFLDIQKNWPLLKAYFPRIT